MESSEEWSWGQDTIQEGGRKVCAVRVEIVGDEKVRKGGGGRGEERREERKMRERNE